jgi:hypothetical protein
MDNWIWLITVLIGLISAGLGVRQGLRNVRESNKVVRQKIEQAESKLEKAPQKAKPAWDLARATLESYFNRNLSQITSIFWLSVIVMLVGFGILIWGISMALRSSTVVVPAAIASVAGVITEFIGATFLFIYRSTIEQAINYSKTLERINSVGMAMQILDTMSDEVKADDLKSKTKATLVELLVRQAYEATVTAKAVSKQP